MVCSGTARRCARLTLPASGTRVPSPQHPDVVPGAYDPGMGAMDDAERLEPATVEEWSAWLRDHHPQPQGVWLVSPRKAAERAFSYEEAVLEALRYGWVDSTVKPVDELRSMQWFAPRRTEQHVDPHQQGARRPPRGGRPDGARRCGRHRDRQGDGHVDPHGRRRGLHRAGRPGRRLRPQPGRARALGVVVGLGAEADPVVDRAREAAGDARRPDLDDGGEGALRGSRRSDAQASDGAAVRAALLPVGTGRQHLDLRAATPPTPARAPG